MVPARDLALTPFSTEVSLAPVSSIFSHYKENYMIMKVNSGALTFSAAL